jgi:ESS family glutamate:Na+ symporter
MVAFFTTIGLGASVGLLRVGGPQVLVFWGLASLLAAVQNGFGVGLARLLGVDPLLGLLTGSITDDGRTRHRRRLRQADGGAVRVSPER